jgi:hypothetical protein
VTDLEEAAFEANERLRSSMELRALVHLATQATKGQVFFQYSTVVEDEIHYMFEGAEKPMDVEAASEWLQKLTREAQQGEPQ